MTEFANHAVNAPGVLKLSPSRASTVLACPRKYHLRYVDGLQSRRLSSKPAFGRAVHGAIAYAYARKNVPLTAAEVADAFEHHLRVLDGNGISYKEGEALDDRVERRTVRGKETDVAVQGLIAEGRALVSLWWENFQEDVLAAKAEAVEARIEYQVSAALQLFGFVDIVEERDGRLYIGDHKVVTSWGPSNERAAAKSRQLLTYCYIWWKTRGRIPDGLYVTVLRRTKTPGVHRCYLMPPTPAELAAFEEELHAVADLCRYHDGGVHAALNVGVNCNMCSFPPLCWGVDGAREFFTTREDRKAVALASAPEDEEL